MAAPYPDRVALLLSAYPFARFDPQNLFHRNQNIPPR